MTADRKPGRDLSYDGPSAVAAGPDAAVRVTGRHRPAVHPLHVGHDRPAQGHRARQWRAHGRAGMVMTNHYGVRPRRDVLGGFRRRLGGWPLLHLYAPLLHGCTTVLYEGKPVGTPDAGAFWRVIAEHGVACCSRRRRRSARSRRRTPTASYRRRDLSRSAPCSWPASARTRRRSVGEEQLKVPVSTTGGRPRPAGGSRQPDGPRASAREARLADGAAAGLRPAGPGRGRQTGRARRDRHIAASCHCRPSRRRRCGSGSRLPRGLPRRIPGYYKTTDAGHIDADGYVS